MVDYLDIKSTKNRAIRITPNTHSKKLLYNEHWDWKK